jgi:hypothetical protein
MDAAPATNWSAVACRAFESHLLALQSKKGVKDMKDVIERLKAAAEIEASEVYQAGREAGETWAKEDATPKQLRRLTEYTDGIDNEPSAPDWWDVDYPHVRVAATYAFAFAALGVNPLNGDVEEAQAFWSQALGDNAERIEDGDFLHGFGDGAADVWRQVEDRL